MYDECDNLDAVIIATPNNVHRNQAIGAARHGIHVVVEKPLAITNTEAWDIVNSCREHNVKLMVGCDRRFWTHNQWAKQLVEDGVIGDVLMSRASLHEHWHNYQNHVAHTDFRLNCEVAGGAAISDTGAHAIDLLTWLNGQKVKRVVGIAKRMAMPESYTQCDDLAWALLEFENGATRRCALQSFFSRRFAVDGIVGHRRHDSYLHRCHQSVSKLADGCLHEQGL